MFLGNWYWEIRPCYHTSSSALFLMVCGWCTSGSACSTCYLMVMDAMNSMFGEKSTSFVIQFNYKRTFKSNVSLLISFPNLVSLCCLADVFSLHTHLAILKQVHISAHFLNKICTNMQTVNLTFSFIAATMKPK